MKPITQDQKPNSTNLQEDVCRWFRLGHLLKWRHLQVWRSRSLRFFESLLRERILTSLLETDLKKNGCQYSLHDEIAAKYSTGEMSGGSDVLMVYKMLLSFFSRNYLNVLATIPVYLAFEQWLETKPLAFWYSPVQRAEVIKESLRSVGMESSQFSQVVNLQEQTVEALSDMIGDRFQFLNMSFGRIRLRISENEGLNLARMPLIYFRNVDRQLSTNRSHGQLQSTRPAPGAAADRPLAGAPANVTFLNWFRQRRVDRLAPASTTTLPVITTGMLFREIISQPYDNARISPGAQPASPAASTQPGVPAISPARGAGTQAAPSPGPNMRSSGLPNLVRQTGGGLGPSASATAETTFAGTGDVAEAMRQLTAIRTEERMEPPRLTYAYAQPVRPTAQQEQVVTRVQEKEVVKLVQKEVESQLTAASILKIFSRADYARIADNVYTSLARQLMVERERLGIH